MPYGDQSYVTDANAVRVRVWGKADEYLCKCTSLRLKPMMQDGMTELLRGRPGPAAARTLALQR